MPLFKEYNTVKPVKYRRAFFPRSYYFCCCFHDKKEDKTKIARFEQHCN
jgi:hypothetical protein